MIATHTDDPIQRLEVLYENTQDDIKKILELLFLQQAQLSHIPAMRQDIGELKDDMRIVKSAVTETNRDLRKLELRVTTLEAKA